MMVMSWRNQGYLRFVDGLCRKMPIAKNARRENEGFWSVEAVKTRVVCAENPLIYHCLTMLNQCLSLLSSKDDKCTFANLVKCIVEV